ncbi:MAG: CehA/McbA family metallohydrolase [Oscillospiraceae bacterium]|nr:CehA/McbA family metallohydrolase [Oscillospiraceae bacterium]
MFTSPYFKTVNITGRNTTRNETDNYPSGTQTYWGIPFDCGDKYIYLNGGDLKLNFDGVKANWLVFLHASETPEAVADEYGIHKNFKGSTQLMEPICDYIINYDDGSEAVVPIRSRMEINDMQNHWGQGAMLAKSHIRGKSFETATNDIYSGRKPDGSGWGNSQTRVHSEGSWEGEQWLYAFENPNPDKTITGIEIIKKNGNVFLFGVTAGDIQEHPLRYGRRQKALLELSGNSNNTFDLIDIDLGHIISVTPQAVYDNKSWENSPVEDNPGDSKKYIVEFDSHKDAILYTGESRTPIAVKDIIKNQDIYINPAEIPVTLKVCDENGKPVPVKIHAHGSAGEYLPPRNRHRLPNPYWFEDYSTDYTRGKHWCTYIDGTAEYLLPPGEVFFEVTKGFEIKPIRCRINIDANMTEIRIKLDRFIDWRSKGWVTADTHVHFLSPQTALLEGEAEGVNVVNLLASQWGELFTNIGDFTGKSETINENGEYIVRVGTENRQHIMGHISLLGYDGAMILPLTTDGPSESAQGDPMELTLTQWAEQCRKQNGLVILPHFPNPRAENAAAIVSDFIDGVEVTKLGATGISPYYLSDWYRYLNCGYHIAAVGGTDKMSAGTAIGEMRTYAKLDGPLTYQTWKQAVIAGKTFVTSGALIDMRVEDQGMGGTLNLSGGANLTVMWDVASVTIPVTSVEFVVNGDTVDNIRFDGLIGEESGYFTINIKESAWIALRVRGRLDGNGNTEVITAHTSAVFVIIDGKPIFNAPDAATILDQIEGATAYIKTLATKAQETQFKLALAALAGAHRALHNRMHSQGYFHNHSPEDKHSGHER